MGIRRFITTSIHARFALLIAAGLTLLTAHSSAFDLVVDNNAPGFAASSNWFPSTSSSGFLGSNYAARATGAVSDSASWSGAIPVAATYQVYARWTTDPNRATAASYVVTTATGTVTVTVNQQQNGGAWVLLGSFPMAAGQQTLVRLSCWTTAGYYVVADAIRVADGAGSSAAVTLSRTLKNAPFYNLAPYYNGTVLLHIPAGFRKTAATDYVYYFHGYRTNVNSAIADFRLRQQIESSGRNVVLVFPETAVNANDPDGGRLDYTSGFTYLANEVAQTLANEGYVANNTIGNIALAGHSGAYLLLANIVNVGGSRTGQIKEMYLFDSMYGSSSTFVSFCRADSSRRLMTIATPSGYGTIAGNDVFRSSLNSYGVSYRFRDIRSLSGAAGKQIATGDMTASRIGIFYNNQDHYLSVHEYDNFARFLQTSPRLVAR